MIKERYAALPRYRFVLLSPFSDDVWSDISPDLEKLGEVSIVRLKGRITIEGFAADIAPLVNERCFVVGFCIGGSVALAVTRSNPQLAGIVLISCMPLPDTERQRVARLDKIARLRMKLGQGVKSPDTTYAKLAAGLMLSRQSLMVDPVRHRAERILGELTPRLALDNHIAMLTRPDFSDDLLDFDRPLLIFIGQQDRIIGARSVATLAARARNARTVVLPTCGHMVPIEMPELVTSSIENWIAEIQGN